jgi:quercetin dioxygenase-like cupin family protein
MAVIGDANPILCRVLACTDQVFLGVATIPPRSRSDELTYPFDVCYHGESGEITLHVSQSGIYFAIHESDVAFVPAGTSHRLFNHTSATQQILIGGAGNFSRLTVASP